MHYLNALYGKLVLGKEKAVTAFFVGAIFAVLLAFLLTWLHL